MFGLLCTDCGNPYTSPTWRAPFLCPPCDKRDIDATAILRGPVVAMGWAS